MLYFDDTTKKKFYLIPKQNDVLPMALSQFREKLNTNTLQYHSQFAKIHFIKWVCFYGRERAPSSASLKKTPQQHRKPKVLSQV